MQWRIYMRTVYPLDLTLVLPMRLRPKSASPLTADAMRVLVDRSLHGTGWKGVHPLKRDAPGAESGFAYSELVYFHPHVRDFLYGAERYGPESGRRPPVRVFSHEHFRVDRPLVRADGTPTGFNGRDALLHHIAPDTAIFSIRLIASGPVEWNDALNAISYLRVLYFQDYRWNAAEKKWEGHGAGLANDVHFQNDGEPEPNDESKKLTQKTVDRTGELSTTLEGGAPRPLAHWSKLLAPLESGDLSYQEFGDHRMASMVFAGMEAPESLSEDQWFGLSQADDAGFPAYAPAFRDAEMGKVVYDRWWKKEAPGSVLKHRFLVTPMTFLSVTWWPTSKAPDYLGHLRLKWGRQQFQMFLLAHYQRAALLIFEKRIAEFAERMQGTPDSALMMEIEDLQADIARFSSGHWFSEVSPQIQAQELYERLRTQLGLTTLYDSVIRDKGLLGNWLDATERRVRDRMWDRFNAIYLPAVLAVTSLGAAPLIEPTGKLLLGAFGVGETTPNVWAGLWEGMLGSVTLAVAVLAIWFLVRCALISRKDEK